MAAVKPLRRSRRLEDQRGNACAYMFMIFGGIAFVWFVFLGIMDIIGSRHSSKLQERMERYEARKPKPKVFVDRKAEGYQVSY